MIAVIGTVGSVHRPRSPHIRLRGANLLHGVRNRTTGASIYILFFCGIENSAGSEFFPLNTQEQP